MSNTINFHINLGSAVARLGQSIKQTSESVAFALIAAERLDDKTVFEYFLEPPQFISLPAVTISLYTSSEPTDMTRVRRSVRAWNITNGLRHHIEKVGEFLEEVRQACAIMSLGRGPFEHDVDLREVIFGRASAFHRLGLPDKIDFIDKAMENQFRGPLTDLILSINHARNCLVHRFGCVGPLDAKDGNALRVCWKRWQAYCRDGDGNESDLQLPGTVPASHQMLIRECSDEKRFALGEVVEFSSQEFSDISWTVFRYAQESVERFESYWSKKGLLTILSPEMSKSDCESAGVS